MPPRKRGVKIPERVAKRAFERWALHESGCYISTYATGSGPYSKVGWFDETGRACSSLAHRAAWTHVHGHIGDLTIDHLPTCDRRCVNVDHLRLLPLFENSRRHSGRDWPLGQCLNGHPNSDRYQTQRGAWICRKCKTNANREWRAQKRERNNA